MGVSIAPFVQQERMYFPKTRLTETCALKRFIYYYYSLFVAALESWLTAADFALSAKEIASGAKLIEL